MASRKLVEAVAVTAELTGTELSEAAARVMVADLSGFPESQVLAALVKCRRELRGRMTIADVISRIEDGRPGPEEAWAMIPKDESGSVVWTEEMAGAFGVAEKILRYDLVAGRMAFLEAYKTRVQAARDLRKPTVWMPSFGTDSRGREYALMDAVEHGRMSAERATSLLPFSVDQAVVKRIEAIGLKMLEKK
jgi:hypothetical protein